MWIVQLLAYRQLVWIICFVEWRTLLKNHDTGYDNDKSSYISIECEGCNLSSYIVPLKKKTNDWFVSQFGRLNRAVIPSYRTLALKTSYKEEVDDQLQKGR